MNPLSGKITGHGIAYDSNGNVKYDPDYKEVKDGIGSRDIRQELGGEPSGGPDRRGERSGGN